MLRTIKEIQALLTKKERSDSDAAEDEPVRPYMLCCIGDCNYLEPDTNNFDKQISVHHPEVKRGSRIRHYKRKQSRC